MFRKAAFVVAISVAAAGCQQPMGNQQAPVFGNQAFSGGRADPSGAMQFAQASQNQEMTELAKEVQALNARLSQFNSDNDDLYTQVAALQQRLEVSNSYNAALKEQLNSTYSRWQKLDQDHKQLQHQVAQQAASNAGLSQTNAPAQFAGATLRANNSLMDKLQAVQMQGAKTWMDGDVIRVEIASDALFVPGQYQLQSTHYNLMSNLATTIRENFPNQVVGIEGHWDGTPIQPTTISHHQLTATQAIAVFDYLVRSGLPHNQIFTMALGSNRPRYNTTTQDGTNPNRRIEIVIYPETFQ